METRFKRSSKLQIREREGRFRAFHSQLGNLVELDEPVVRCLEGMREARTIEQAASTFFPEISLDAASDVVAELANLGFIIPERNTDGGESAVPYDAEYMLRLFVTDSCNYTCKYCYESKSLRQGVSNMSTEVVDSAIGFFIEHYGLDSSTVGEVQFRLYGGEPLLYPDTVSYALEQAQKRLGSRCNDFFMMVNSNGSLVTDELAKLLRDTGTQLAISLDGLESVNDSMRVYSSGKGTFQDTMRGIECLLQHNVLFAVNVTVASHNLHMLNEMVDYLASVGVTNISFNRLKPGPDTPAESIGGDYYVEFIENVWRAFKHGQGKGLNIGGLWALYQERLVDGQARYCSGCGYQICVSPDGNVYACPHLYPDAEYSWGSVLNGAVDQERYELFRSRTVNNMGCSTCEVSGVCAGGCMAASHLAGGSLYAPEACAFHKLAIDRFLWDIEI